MKHPWGKYAFSTKISEGQGLGLLPLESSEHPTQRPRNITDAKRIEVELPGSRGVGECA